MKTVTFAAVVFLNTTETHVLLLKRAAWKELNPNTYSGIGGKLEASETPEECLSREVSEEASQIEWNKVEGLRCHLVLTHVIPEKNRTHIMHWFTATLAQPLVDFSSTEGSLHWIPVNELPLPLEEMSKSSWLAIPYMLGRLSGTLGTVTANVGEVDGLPVLQDVV